MALTARIKAARFDLMVDQEGQHASPEKPVMMNPVAEHRQRLNA
jgi:hypothetical protein